MLNHIKPVTICDRFHFFIIGQLESKIHRESVNITPCHPIKLLIFQRCITPLNFDKALFQQFTLFFVVFKYTHLLDSYSVKFN